MVYVKMVYSTSGQLARRLDALKMVTVNRKNRLLAVRLFS